MMQKFAKFIVLVTVLLMDFLAGMEFDLFVPSFPEIQNQFNLTPFYVEALLSVNFIGYCISLFVVGSLADHFGRKPIIISGLIIFILGSLLCVWGLSYELLLLGRFLQGIGVAAPAILSFLIIADTYPIKKQQSLIAIMGGLMNVSVAVAPVLGSYITMYFHWRGNFTALLLMGLLTLIMTVVFIPSYKLPQHHETQQVQSYISLLLSRPMRLLMVHIIFMFVPYWIFVGMSPILFMEDLGVSLSQFGYYQGLLAFVYGLGSILFGMVVTRFNEKKMLIVSNYIFIGGLICIAIVTFQDSVNPLIITLSLLPFAIGQIIPSAILYPLSLNFKPQAKGRASAMIQGGRLIFSAMSLQVAGYFYQGSFRNIGLMIGVFVFLTIVTLVMVCKYRALMTFSH
jgi:DHA1 family bicyclomycin/chloramphenicol resistance-like MFS transporter